MGRSKKLTGDAIRSTHGDIGKSFTMRRANPEKIVERADRDEEENRERKKRRKIRRKRNGRRI